MLFLTSVFIYYVYTFLTILPLTFDVNGQTNLTFVFLCSLLSSYVVLIYLIHQILHVPSLSFVGPKTSMLSQPK